MAIKNKNIINYVSIFIVVICGYFCYGYLKDPYNIKIPANPELWDTTIIKEIGSLPEHDKKTVISYLDRHNPILNNEDVIEDIPYNLTIKEAIILQNKYMKDPSVIIKLNQEKEAKKKEKILTDISNTVFVTYISQELTLDNKLIITYAIKNKSSKQISLVKGNGVLKESNGVLLSNISESFKLEPAIPQNQTAVYNQAYSTDTISNFNILSTLNNRTVIFSFNVEEVVFSDGTNLKI